MSERGNWVVGEVLEVSRRIPVENLLELLAHGWFVSRVPGA
jgi:uncharacterized protein (DUF433 family)